MKVQVILFGMLRKGFPTHDPKTGVEIDIPDGSTVGELIEQLELPKAKLGMVTVESHLAKEHRKLAEGECVRIFQPIFGG